MLESVRDRWWFVVAVTLALVAGLLFASTMGSQSADAAGGIPPALVFANHGGPNTECSEPSPGQWVCDVIDGDLFRDSRDVAVGDLNGDLVLDAVFANDGQPDTVCFGNTQGGWGWNCVDVPGPLNSRGVAIGDLDGDSDLDIVFVSDTQKNRSCLNQGGGAFQCQNADQAAPGLAFLDVELGHLNPNVDAHLDMALAVNGENWVGFGNGDGTFTGDPTLSNATATLMGLGSPFRNSRGVAIGDITGTGIDVVFANKATTPGSPVLPTVCSFDLTGSSKPCVDVQFIPNSATGSPSTNYQDVSLGDIDQPSGVDAVFADDVGNQICMNIAGTLTCTLIVDTPPPPSETANGVALGDIDADLDLDAAFARPGFTNRMCLNNGSGEFTCVDVTQRTDQSNEVAFFMPGIRGCRGQPATILGDAGNNVLFGTGGPDVIWAGDGDDLVIGRGGSDLICLGDGDDYADGGGGKDRIFGEDGEDTIRGSGHRDRIDGGADNDKLLGGQGDDRLLGRSGADLLIGDAGDDKIRGGSGDDQLYGRDGEDLLLGGTGPDFGDGGNGIDTCVNILTHNCP